MGDTTHGNKICRSGSPRLDLIRASLRLRKIPASSVRYGDIISTNGKTVWAAFDVGDDTTPVGIGATAGEARQRYREWWDKREAEAGHRILVPETE